MNLNISKVHKDSIIEYIYNKLDEEQLYSPFIDEELEKRIRHICEDVYETGYKDGQETEKLEDKEERKIIFFQVPKDEKGNMIPIKELKKCGTKLQESLINENIMIISTPFNVIVNEDNKEVVIDIDDIENKTSDESVEHEFVDFIKNNVEPEGYNVVLRLIGSIKPCEDKDVEKFNNNKEIRKLKDQININDESIKDFLQIMDEYEKKLLNILS